MPAFEIASQMLRGARLRAALPYIEGRVLDVGCGGGVLYDLLGPRPDYLGIDVAAGAVETACRLHPGGRFLRMDVEAEPPPCEPPFDTICMLAVIEHLHNPAGLIERYMPALKEGGRLVVTSPSPSGDRLHRLLQRLGLARKEVSDVHISVLGLKEMKEMLEAMGMEVLVARRFELGMNQLLVARKRAG